MADFTLNAPGTTNDPWPAPNMSVLVGTLQSDSQGFRNGSSGPGFSIFVHDANYGSTITAAIQASTISTGDDVLIGAVVRTGANAKAFIGVVVDLVQVYPLTLDTSSNGTAIATTVGISWATSDIISCQISLAAGVATIRAFQNASEITFASNTTTNYATESSLAAGGLFSPQNVNGTRLSQFTGTGVVAAPKRQLLTMIGNQGGF